MCEWPSVMCSDRDQDTHKPAPSDGTACDLLPLKFSPSSYWCDDGNFSNNNGTHEKRGLCAPSCLHHLPATCWALGRESLGSARSSSARRGFIRPVDEGWSVRGMGGKRWRGELRPSDPVLRAGEGPTTSGAG